MPPFSAKSFIYKDFLSVAIIALLVFLFLAPIFLHINQYIYGYHGDPTGTLWLFWWYKDAYWKAENPHQIPILAAPFGVDYSNIPRQPTFFTCGIILSKIFSETVAYNLITIAAFFLSGLGMYIFLRYGWLAKDRKANAAEILNSSQPFNNKPNLLENFYLPWLALYGALLFTFSPYHTMRATAHLSLSTMQWIPLYFFFFWRLFNKPKFSNSILLALSFLILFLENFYYGFFTSILSIIIFSLTILQLFWDKYKKHSNSERSNYINSHLGKYLKWSAISFFIAAILIGSLTWKTIWHQKLKPAPDAEVSSTKIEHPLQEVERLSAKPVEYFLPSLMNPLLGRSSIHYFNENLRSSVVEQTLYLGFIPLILSLFGFSKSKSKATSKNDVKIRISSFTILIAALSAFLLSLPPQINIYSFKIYLPSYLLFKAAPMFRGYARFGLFCNFFICLLATFGLKNILMRISSSVKRNILFIIVVTLSFLEYLSLPPFPITRVDVASIPAPYKWLEEQKDSFTIAEYPLIGQEHGRFFDYLYFQKFHHKPILNGALPKTSAFYVSRSLANLEDPDTPHILSALGVRFVILHEDIYRNPELPAVFQNRWLPKAKDEFANLSNPKSFFKQIPDLSRNINYELVKKIENTNIYQLNAEPLDIFTVAGEGFYDPEWDSSGRFQWLAQKGQILILNRKDQPLKISLAFEIWSLNEKIKLHLYNQKANLADFEAIPAERRMITTSAFDIQPGWNKLDFYAEEKTQKISAVIGGEDQRTVTVALSSLKTIQQEDN